MTELINKEVYKVGDSVSLYKFPQASGRIIKVNKTSIEVKLISADKSVDNRIFKITPSDIEYHWPIKK